MKKLTLLLSVFLLVACTKVDRPGPKDATPRQRWFPPYAEKMGAALWPDELIEDKDLTGPGGNFEQAWARRADARDKVELMALFNLPEAELAAMSTRNLLLTCYIYPYNGDIWFYDNDYDGVAACLSQFNGWLTLMQRKSAPDELVRLYRELEYPATYDGFYTPLDYTEYNDPTLNFGTLGFLTYVLMTAADYHRFTRDHVRLLAPEVIRKIENLFINQESYTWQGHLRDPYLLGAFLAWHYDDSLSDEDCKTLANFLDPYSIAEETDMVHRPGVPVKKDPESGLWMPDEDAINAAATIIAASMERLK